MVAVALQQQATLARCAGRIESGDRLVLQIEYAMLGIYGKPAFVVHEHRSHRAQSNERRID
jgi:hypothetical protein